MADYPRYFCFGEKYYPPHAYYRADSQANSVLVVPGGQELHVNYMIDFFQKPAVSPVTKNEIDGALTKWEKHNGPLKSSLSPQT